MRGGRLRHLYLGALLTLCTLGAPAQTPPVLAVLSERTPPYLEAAGALTAELGRSAGLQPGRDIIVAAPGDLPAAAPASFVVALGTEACRQAAASASSAPVLCALLPRASFELILQEQGRRPGPGLSALYLNQSLARQLALIHLALPSAHRVGILVHAGPTPLRDAAADSAAQALGLKLVLGEVPAGDSVYGALKKLLDDADVLLAMADPHIYNPESVQNILLASFRARVPMVAFSPAYARAGALLAVYTTPAQTGTQAAQILRASMATGALGPPQYPLQFELSVNDQVARSLGLSIDAAQLAERLRRTERNP